MSIDEKDVDSVPVNQESDIKILDRGTNLQHERLDHLKHLFSFRERRMFTVDTKVHINCTSVIRYT